MVRFRDIISLDAGERVVSDRASRLAARLVDLLAVPTRPEHLINSNVHFLLNAANQAQSVLALLPNELLLQVLDYLPLHDIYWFSLVAKQCWNIGLYYVMENPGKFMGTWAGTRLISWVNEIEAKVILDNLLMKHDVRELGDPVPFKTKEDQERAEAAGLQQPMLIELEKLIPLHNPENTGLLPFQPLESSGGK